MATTPVKRGCGTRVEGGIYAECGLSETGAPLERFLFDPVVPVPADLTIPIQGVGTMTNGETTHVVDRVGVAFYPNASDFIEEVRRFGLSRRIPKSFDFSRLSEGSRILIVHPRGLVDAWPEFVSGRWLCPNARIDHAPEALAEALRLEAGRDSWRRSNCCAGLQWEAVTGGVEVTLDEQVPGYNYRTGAFVENVDALTWRADERLVRVECASFSYHARRAPEGVDPSFGEAFVASFPISNLCVVRAADGSHEEAAARALAAGIPVELSDK